VSATDVIARVSEIQRMLGAAPAAAASPAPAPAPAPAPGVPAARTFAGRLASAGAPRPDLPSAPGLTGIETGSRAPFAADIDAAAARYGLDPALLRGLIRQESNFDPGAVSAAGARGLTQLMPGTAAALGVDPTVPAQAIDGGARYLREQLDRFGGDPAKGLAAYNAGPGAVQRYGGVPPYAETQGYVRNVMAYAAAYRQSPPSPAGLDGPPAGADALPYSTA
jgi:soluble lytic murein transglycosylase-like protein